MNVDNNNDNEFVISVDEDTKVSNLNLCYYVINYVNTFVRW